VRVVPTLHRDGSQLSHDILGAIGRKFAVHQAPEPIREHELLREAASHGQTVVAYAPGSPAHEDFRRLAAWIAASPAAVSDQSAASAGGAHAAPVYVAEATGAPPEGTDGLAFPRLAGSGRAAELAQRMRTGGVPASGPGVP
jgi:hypothetical protein